MARRHPQVFLTPDPLINGGGGGGFSFPSACIRLSLPSTPDEPSPFLAGLRTFPNVRVTSDRGRAVFSVNAAVMAALCGAAVRAELEHVFGQLQRSEDFAVVNVTGFSDAAVAALGEFLVSGRVSLTGGADLRDEVLALFRALDVRVDPCFWSGFLPGGGELAELALLPELALQLPKKEEPLSEYESEDEAPPPTTPPRVRQRSDVSGEGERHQCASCEKSFANKHSLYTHTRLWHRERLYHCGLCKRAFARKSLLKQHKMMEHAQHPWQCRLCDESFSSKHFRMLHRQNVHGEQFSKSYKRMLAASLSKCELCDVIVADNVELVAHFKREHSVSIDLERGPYCCYFCEYQSMLRYGLMLHLNRYRSHTKMSFRAGLSLPLTCKECALTMTTHDEVDAHINMHIGSLPEQELRCMKCSLNFKKIKQLKTHLQYCGTDFVCQYCGTSGFTSRGSINLHIKQQHPSKFVYIKKRTGLKEQKGTCPTCGQYFLLRRQLLHHIRMSHGGAGAPKTCDQCGKQFRDLKWHMKNVHTEERHKPFQCTVCKKGFNAKRLLDAHGVIHTGEKPFRCELCDYAASFSHNISKHMKLVHKVTKSMLSCTVCGCKKWNEDLLQSHMDKMHPEHTV